MSKYLGQHFLKNKGKINDIVDALNLEGGDTVVEIGPGNGALTKEIAKRGKKVKIIGIEKDKALVNKLVNSRFVSRGGGIEIIEGDVLKILPKLPASKTTTYKLVGNIPYYITGRLLRLLGEMEEKPEIIILTVQKEVAERLTAKPPRMNILAASVQIWGKVDIIDYIPKNDFRPKPAVDSAVIRIIPLGEPVPDKYYPALKILFRHPRKTVLNNLSAGLGKTKEEILRKLEEKEINLELRPQDFEISTIKEVSRMLQG